MKIVVLTNGFVLICKECKITDKHIQMTTVRCIRRWGTNAGLGQLVNGPTKETQLDTMIPVVSAPLHSLVFEFNVQADKWSAYLQ